MSENHQTLVRPHRGLGRRARWPRALLVACGRPVVRRLFHLHVEGDQHVPATGPAIIAANHMSFFDHIALAVAVPRRVNFVGKAEYLDSWKTRRLLPALGMIPIDRSRPRRAVAALEQAADVLQDDEVFAVYPEGTSSRDGALHAGHTGVGHLSATTGVSIIPAGIVGTDRIQPPGARLPRPSTLAVVSFGAPIDPAAYKGTHRERRRHITADVMRAIRQLTGQTLEPGVTRYEHNVAPPPHDAAHPLAILPTGETLQIDERIVVSPSAGVFTPLAAEGTPVEVGQQIGHVRTRRDTVPVCTPFTGELVAMSAWDGERVDRCQRLAWVRRRD
jgi:1-acyl-sn-glycerol-3-phosphate acyltransferase